MSKKAFDAARGDSWTLNPITQICIIGGQCSEVKLPEDQWGDLDTEHDEDSHSLFNKSLYEPLDPIFVASIAKDGVDVPILITKQDDMACVIEGRKRVRATRIVNRQRAKMDPPLPPLMITAVTKRASGIALLGMMTRANGVRVEDSWETQMHAVRRSLDGGVPIESIAIDLGKSVATIQGWIKFDDNACAAVKKAVEQGKLNQTAASHLVDAGDPAAQKEALDALLASGATPTRKAAKETVKKAKNKSKPEANSIELSTKREQKTLLDYVQNMKHPSASDTTLGFWDGVENTLLLVLGSEGVDARLTKALAAAREAK